MCGVLHLIVGEEKALLIDTGYGYFDPHETIREITSLNFDIVISHGHFDHAGGAHLFPDEKVYIHKADIPVYEKHSSPEYKKKAFLTLNKLQWLLFFLGLKLLPKNLDIKALCRLRFNNFYFIEDGYGFDLGGCSAKIVEIPGHTPGSVGILVPEKQLMIVTDAANPATWMFLPESTKLSVYCNSLKKIRTQDFDHILTGHSAEIFTKADLDKWIEVAEEPDFKHGRKRKNDFAPGIEVRTCFKCGSSKKDMKRPKILVSIDKL